MRKAIVITSIYEPTEAVLAFAKMEDHQLIVVGDRKTPTGWQCPNADYLSVDKQASLNYTLAKALPYDHYCRKMLGYLKAIEDGAEFIVDADDDNIPKSDWGFPSFNGEYDSVEPHQGFINIYQYFTDQKIWPRGLPLRLISKQHDMDQLITSKTGRIGVWQGLADENPDVDAVFRLTDGSPCSFEVRPPIVLGKGTISPFNTQNTMIRKELLALLYLPADVTFRFTDILRGLVAQPIMWLYGYHLGFTNATVVQKRHPHDYMKDFISEIPMYRYSETVVESVAGSISAEESIENNLYNAYESLLRNSIVSKLELSTLKSWLQDLSELRVS